MDMFSVDDGLWLERIQHKMQNRSISYSGIGCTHNNVNADVAVITS